MKSKPFLYLLILLFLVAACNQEPKLSVSGVITHAKGKMLYFEQFGLNKVEILDSTLMDLDGKFRFKTTLPGAPEFYRLRIENRFIHLSTDSTVKVKITADAEQFGQNYRVEGSQVCNHIRILSEWQDKSLTRINELTKAFQGNELSEAEYTAKVQGVFSKHKEIAGKIILDNPLSPAAYFALFQRIHNYLVFDTYESDDNLYFRAVASSWEAIYPNAVRTKHLSLLALQGMKALRASKKSAQIPIIQKNNPSYFEVELSDAFGRNKSLSSLIGKVVLLDFTSLQAEFSPDRNLYLRTVYQKFANRGFEIYQISYDKDEQFWKTSASNLPWISVRDKSLNRSEYLRVYNIVSIPTYFLIDKNGDIYKRDVMVKDLEKDLQQLL